MGDAVWMSRILKPSDWAVKQGIRAKYFGREWDPESFTIPTLPPSTHAKFRRSRQGYSLDRADFTEAIAVFDEQRFSRRNQIFYAGAFYGVEGKLAEVLSRFDLGEGGLIPLPVYQSDLETSYPGEFWLLNFGCRKDTILIDQCGDASPFVMNKTTGLMLHHINRFKSEAEVVFDVSALDGPDLWFEQSVHEMVFMSDRLARAIADIGLADIFRLHRCEVVGVA